MKQAQANETMYAYLQHNRYKDTERDGWFSLYEITSGIEKDLAVKISLVKAMRCLAFLQNECSPPRIEDAWMLGDDEGTPILAQRYTHPNQPEHARRFYRALSVGLEYFKPE